MKRRAFIATGAVSFAGVRVAASEAPPVAGSELLIQMTHSRPLTGDPLVDSKTWRPGDVLEAREIGHPGWGREELALPMFRIVRLPHIPLTVARMWTTSEPSIRPYPMRTLQMRMHAFHLEHEALPDFRRWLSDDRRSRRRPIWELHEARLLPGEGVHYRELLVRKPAILDPDLV